MNNKTKTLPYSVDNICLWKKLFIFFSGIFLSACASNGGLSDQADELGTQSAYHCALNWQDSDCICPDGTDEEECKLRENFQYDGILLGIEKSDKVGGCSKPKGNGLKDDLSTAGVNKENIIHLKNRLNDKKSMYLSHAVEYSSNADRGRVFYNSYNFISPEDACKDNYPDRISFNNMSPPANLYLRGEKELWSLKKRLQNTFKNAQNSGSPFTHVILMSMGWSNDQPESLRRYNKITEHLIKSANANHQTNFKPFVIGVSWPSAWCSSCYGWVSKFIGHIGSYANKANDADEIGYTLLNRVLNNVLSELKQEAGSKYNSFKLITLGHSMGARITTRAVFSKPLLIEGFSEKTEVDLVIGLQGAFSINRFIKDFSLSVPISREGGPYANYYKMDSKFIMTWSSLDTANPLSRLINGSKHIGGLPGYEETQKNDKSYPFSHVNWPSGEKYKLSEYEKETCSYIPHDHSVTLVNMSSVIDDHNDVLDADVGRFLWCAITQFAM